MQPGNTAPRYLTGIECVDVNRLTGIPMSCGNRLGQRPETHAGAVDQGVLSVDEVFIDLSRLNDADRARIMWARIAAHEWLRTDVPGTTRESWTEYNKPRGKRASRSNRVRGVAAADVCPSGA